MKRILVVLLILATVFTGLFANGSSETVETKEWKPEQPITIMNHVAVSGAMDLYSRKWVEIAAKYTDATFVVNNNSGANGLTAGEWVLNQDADGYSVFALGSAGESLSETIS